MKIYPVIPNAYEYAMEASEKGVLGAVLSKAKGFTIYQKVRLGRAGPDQDQERPDQGRHGPPPRAPRLRDAELREVNARRGLPPRPAHRHGPLLAQPGYPGHLRRRHPGPVQGRTDAGHAQLRHPPAPAHGVGDQAADHGPLQRQGLHDEAVPGRVRDSSWRPRATRSSPRRSWPAGG